MHLTALVSILIGVSIVCAVPLQKTVFNDKIVSSLVKQLLVENNHTVINILKNDYNAIITNNSVEIRHNDNKVIKSKNTLRINSAMEANVCGGTRVISDHWFWDWNKPMTNFFTAGSGAEIGETITHAHSVTVSWSVQGKYSEVLQLGWDIGYSYQYSFSRSCGSTWQFVGNPGDTCIGAIQPYTHRKGFEAYDCNGQKIGAGFYDEYDRNRGFCGQYLARSVTPCGRFPIPCVEANCKINEFKHVYY
jgi:hypothetical protein